MECGQLELLVIFCCLCSCIELGAGKKSRLLRRILYVSGFLDI